MPSTPKRNSRPAAKTAIVHSKSAKEALALLDALLLRGVVPSLLQVGDVRFDVGAVERAGADTAIESNAVVDLSSPWQPLEPGEVEGD